MLDKVRNITKRIKLQCLGVHFDVRTDYDVKGGDRVFIQILYRSPCTETGQSELWKGRKYYLSEFMTDDEIVKTVYVAFEQAVKHEVMEGFTIDNKILFNPHINFEALLEVSDRTIKRDGLDEIG